MRLRPDLWHLDPEVVHLNHGSFGAVPVPVLDAQTRASVAIERSPERFYRSDLARGIEAVRGQLAEFLATDPEGLALVQNATEAVRVVLEAVDMQRGSEVVITDHAYGWVRAAVERACRERGSVVRLVKVPMPTDSADGVARDAGRVNASEFAQQVTAAISAALTERTALVVIDQITSASALLMPVDALIAAVTAFGGDIPVLVDGAHAPGLIDAPVPAGAAFWLGNLHKWAFAARTAAALVVAPGYRERVRPLVASAGWEAGYPRSFTYLGTQDPTAFLALPESLAFPETYLGMSFAALRERNSTLLDVGLERLRALSGARPGPDTGLPIRTANLGVTGSDKDATEWTTRLRAAGVEVAITSVAGALHARVSVQAYVALDDFDRLGEAVKRLVGADD